MHKLYCDENQISYGQKYLLDLCNKRKLSEFYKNTLFENDKDNFSQLFYLATGKLKTPPLSMIFKLAEYIDPSDWFYTVAEPQPKHLTPGTKLVDDIKNSINYKKLYKMYEQHTLFEFCENNKIIYSGIYHIISGRSLITPVRIKSLRIFFEPINWFIE